MVIIQFSHFAAPYKGNFIRSLEKLEEFMGSTYKFIYCFPKSAESIPWMKEFSTLRKVYFTSDNVRKTTEEIFKILKEVRPAVVHTHFDGYDVSVTKARNKYIKNGGNNIKVVWHLRNRIRYESNILKKIYQFIVFKNHYGKWAKNANIITVSNEMKIFVESIKKRGKLNVLTEIIPNGINATQFLNKPQQQLDDYYTFGAFGSRNASKRIDILLEAANILNRKGLRFKVLITKGVDTKDVVDEFFNSDIPSWLRLVEQTENIFEFYNQLSCFVSSSVHETFSNAIAEASMFGIPVIQSNIPGTMWNSSNPSTFLFDSLNSNNLSLIMEEVMNLPIEEMKVKCCITQENNMNNYGIDTWCEKIIDFYKRSN